MVIEFPNLFTEVPIRRIACPYGHIFPGMLRTNHWPGYNFRRLMQYAPEVMHSLDNVVIEEKLLGGWLKLQPERVRKSRQQEW